jgi:hypothetical protein
MTIFVPATFQFSCHVPTSDLISTVTDLAFLSNLTNQPQAILIM